jgi:hypothetical protein
VWLVFVAIEFMWMPCRADGRFSFRFLGGGWLLGLLGVCVTSYEGHMVDALASRADEGRRSLRKALGSWQPSCDPGMSEWGNPAGVMSSYLRLNI